MYQRELHVQMIHAHVAVARNTKIAVEKIKSYFFYDRINQHDELIAKNGYYKRLYDMQQL